MLTVTDVAGRVELCPNGMPLPPQTTAFTVCKGAPMPGKGSAVESGA